MTQTTQIIRQAVESKIEDQLTEALRKQHELNYEKLYVSRDGDLWWSEDVNRDTQLIDREAEGFAGVPYLIQVGTGSCSCNCDWCDGPNAVEDTNDIDFESDEYDEFRRQMLDNLAQIDTGYFRDEEAA